MSFTESAFGAPFSGPVPECTLIGMHERTSGQPTGHAVTRRSPGSACTSQRYTGAATSARSPDRRLGVRERSPFALLSVVLLIDAGNAHRRLATGCLARRPHRGAQATSTMSGRPATVGTSPSGASRWETTCGDHGRGAADLRQPGRRRHPVVAWLQEHRQRRSSISPGRPGLRARRPEAPPLRDAQNRPAACGRIRSPDG